MTVAAFSALLIASGYLWLRLWLLSKAVLTRGDSNSLYFIVVIAAFCLGLAGYGLAVGVSHVPIAGPFLYDTASKFITPLIADAQPVSKVLGFCLLTFFAPALAPLLAWFLNLPLWRNPELTDRLVSRLRSPNELDCLITEAAERGLPIMMTTGSGKVYIGFALEAPDPGGSRKWIRLEPTLSGYRDDKKEFIPTTDYAWIHALPTRGQGAAPGPCIEDFDILIAADDIKHFHKFDIEAYCNMYQGEKSVAVDTIAPRARTPRNRANKARASRKEWAYLGFVVSVLASFVVVGIYPAFATFLAAFAVLLGVYSSSTPAAPPAIAGTAVPPASTEPPQSGALPQ